MPRLDAWETGVNKIGKDPFPQGVYHLAKYNRQ